MKILVVGTGYVGLVSGVCFAEMGHHVTCLDVDQEKILRLQQGEPTIYEPGLEEMLKRNLAAKRLEFTTDYAQGMRNALACFLAVGTPMGEEGSPDLSQVMNAARQVAQHMDDYHIIVNKSTVPVGTAQQVRNVIREELARQDKSSEFDMVSNPEFLKEGDAINDFMKPDRIIIGVDNVRVGAIMQELYSAFTFNHERIMLMDIASAELTKYAANAMLATRISFMNELALLCEQLGADITTVRRGIGSDQRIGHHFLYAGPGYGGSCFPKDVQALIATARQKGCSSGILEAVESANARQKRYLGEKILTYLGEGQGKTVGIWGLAFKPNTDDMREAPALTLIRQLLQAGVAVRLFDPIAMDNAKGILPDHPLITWCTDELDAAQGVDALALITEWKQFRFVNLDQVAQVMNGKAFFDGRNQYKPLDMQRKGFHYVSIGRPGAAEEVSHACQ